MTGSRPSIRHPGELRWETRLLAVVTATLVVFGIAASWGAASLLPGGSRFGLDQMSGALLGGIGFIVLSRVDYRVWRPLAWPLILATIVLLIVPLLPFTHAIAPTINGARRWVDLGPVSVQPSEAARLSIVIWCAMLAAKKGEQVRQFKKGVLPFMVVIGFVSALILLEPNLSMATLIAMLGGLVLFTAGAKIGHFLLILFGVVLIIANRIHDVEYRIRRFTAFLDPSVTHSPAAYQLQQSLIGFGSGRLLGVGFGQGQQKLGYLPYAYSDFLFSTIGEEWGFVGVVVVIALFVTFCWLGFRIARTASDSFGQYLAVGLTAAIGVTAMLHIAVNLGLMPTTGLSLPFMSHGRSSLIISMCATGILVNIGRQRGKPGRARREGGKAGRRKG